MNGKTAIVTGSSHDIGAATAKLLGERGANVVVNYYSSPDAAEKVVEYIENNGGRAIAVKADARDKEDLAQLAQKAKETFGSIDIFVHNAGMKFPMKSFEDMEWDEFIHKTDDELQAAFFGTKAVIPYMKEQKYGKLVYISSGLSKRAAPNFLAHGVSKSSLNAFVKYVADEFSDQGITANTVAPGMVETNVTSGMPQEYKDQQASFVPMKRIAQPEDVAKAVAFFASNDSDYITGSYMPVSGGSEMI